MKRKRGPWLRFWKASPIHPTEQAYGNPLAFYGIAFRSWGIGVVKQRKPKA